MLTSERDGEMARKRERERERGRCSESSGFTLKNFTFLCTQKKFGYSDKNLLKSFLKIPTLLIGSKSL